MLGGAYDRGNLLQLTSGLEQERRRKLFALKADVAAYTVGDISAMPAKVLYTGPDYGIGIVEKCLGPTTSKGPAKDGCKIF